MLQCVALLKTDYSEERITSVIRAIRIGELGTTLPVTSNRSTLLETAAAAAAADAAAAAAAPRVLRSAILLLVAGTVVPSSPVLVTLMTETIRSSETSVLT
jgi:hypothetical protein